MVFWSDEGTCRLIEQGPVEQIFESPKEEITAAYVRGMRG
jgi:ABC-type phosphate transport system ATPase subunit